MWENRDIQKDSSPAYDALEAIYAREDDGLMEQRKFSIGDMVKTTNTHRTWTIASVEITAVVYPSGYSVPGPLYAVLDKNSLEVGFIPVSFLRLVE